MVVKIIFRSDNNWLKDSNYTLEEEAEIYDYQLDDILENTRWYLDNIDFMKVYRVRWHQYSLLTKDGKEKAVLPNKYVRKQIGL